MKTEQEFTLKCCDCGETIGKTDCETTATSPGLCLTCLTADNATHSEWGANEEEALRTNGFANI